MNFFIAFFVFLMTSFNSLAVTNLKEVHQKFKKAGHSSLPDQESTSIYIIPSVTLGNFDSRVKSGCHFKKGLIVFSENDLSFYEVTNNMAQKKERYFHAFLELINIPNALPENNIVWMTYSERISHNPKASTFPIRVSSTQEKYEGADYHTLYAEKFDGTDENRVLLCLDQYIQNHIEIRNKSFSRD